ALPFLVSETASQYTNYSLRQQQAKVLDSVKKNGIGHYLQGDDSFGSYTLLKEEFIAFLPVGKALLKDTIKDSQRLLEGDILNYRVLSHTFKADGKIYLLEIGKATKSIGQYNKPLQRFALYVLIGLVALSTLFDLTFIRLLIRPLELIIKTKLINRVFPFKNEYTPVKTSTTDFKYLDESLTVLMRQVNEAFHKEREFTSNASHELMTPISILQNKMENLLGDEQLSDAAALSIVEMMKTVNRLKKITSSLLLISRVENEQYIRKEQVDLLPLFEEIIEEIGHRLEEKNLSIFLELERGVLVRDANKDLLYQLFFNLVHNAIKFNREAGSIFITGTDLDHGRYELSIRDTGIGIPDSDLPMVFNRFMKTNLDAQVGYGLGLAIVKSIASYHRVDFRVESKLAQGTTFKLVFDVIKQG
ncbi:MAG TPA: HAMP domain-containing sensor histidine kinase, partial [Pedobacter sp.]|nr:HAMP domain-containing sensor histidine kinase [Pedobacter sp.]